MYNRYSPTEEVAFLNEYRGTRYLIRDILMKPDVVPLAADLLHALRCFQETVFSEIIRGEKDLGEFDAFIEEWRRRGGDRLTAEANELLEARKRVYRIVGVPGSAGVEAGPPGSP